jgi:hypothetical protein
MEFVFLSLSLSFLVLCSLVDKNQYFRETSCPENGGCMILRNIGTCLPNYKGPCQNWMTVIHELEGIWKEAIMG